MSGNTKDHWEQLYQQQERERALKRNAEKLKSITEAKKKKDRYLAIENYGIF